jgi:hypothetical protein
LLAVINQQKDERTINAKQEMLSLYLKKKEFLTDQMKAKKIEYENLVAKHEVFLNKFKLDKENTKQKF